VRRAGSARSIGPTRSVAAGFVLCNPGSGGRESTPCAPTRREPTVYHITQLRQLLAACSADHPTQKVAVRTLGWNSGPSPGHTDSI
jgi:hypothetical protein